MEVFYIAFWIVMIGTMLWMASRIEECPEEMLGFNCKGEKCDHSEKALEDVKKARRGL